MNKRTSGLRAYLFSSGVLPGGEPLAIAEATHAYWRMKDAEYKKKRRREMRECLVRLNKEEEKALNVAAKEHGLTIQEFLKHSSIAYTRKIYLQKDRQTTFRIEALLLRTLTGIQQLQRKEPNRLWPRSGSFEEVQGIVFDLKKELERELQQPALLEEAIRQTLSARPEFRNALLKLLT